MTSWRGQGRHRPSLSPTARPCSQTSDLVFRSRRFCRNSTRCFGSPGGKGFSLSTDVLLPWHWLHLDLANLATRHVCVPFVRAARSVAALPVPRCAQPCCCCWHVVAVCAAACPPAHGAAAHTQAACCTRGRGLRTGRLAVMRCTAQHILLPSAPSLPARARARTHAGGRRQRQRDAGRRPVCLRRCEWPRDWVGQAAAPCTYWRDARTKSSRRHRGFFLTLHLLTGTSRCMELYIVVTTGCTGNVQPRRVAEFGSSCTRTQPSLAPGHHGGLDINHVT